MSHATSFRDFDLIPSLLDTLTERRLKTPTDIQTRAIPALLVGESVVGVAATGTGKTLAYALPILHQLKSLENRGDRVTADARPRAVVVVPTRELGEQVSKAMKPFTHTTRLRVRVALGGTAMEVARRNVAGTFEILVATPGRLVQLLTRKLVSLDDVRTLVFDEADQVLDQGFLEDAGRIVAACPEDRQMALFSATVSPTVQSLIKDLFEDARVFRAEGSHRLPPGLTIRNLEVIDGKRFPLLEKVLETRTQGGTVIFTNTRRQCDELARQLEESGRSCVVYRGEMDKLERRRNLKAFIEGRIELLVSTDLASRGLDIERIERVINYHLPQELEPYIHRVGRTARAGRNGLVINLVTERDEPLIAQLATIARKG
jgi:superfamily II DNA/RNA helicase